MHLFFWPNLLLYSHLERCKTSVCAVCVSITNGGDLDLCSYVMGTCCSCGNTKSPLCKSMGMF